MKFYDVKTKKSVELPVFEKKIYEGRGTRYALIGKTTDGRALFSFCNKEKFDKAVIGK